ncbi:cysteine desulfurase [Citricoccus sp. SGAir0253]|uniref:cysteine desulfurase family protein n=1 Tax=Citricoccus sp. SGAir0253 TaxID=2567881 RepID=UPI0010CCD4BB|nr:cysteine desulfurase family protein [Citricoccus sp. SGAir0253]QCU77639.1 cysteine desulfurase [Citricoccus sp. SGAir0253]
MIYLDHAATSPVRREALEAMWPYLTGDFGNPSSHHGLGESAARGLADARAAVARILGTRAAGVVFTGSGTEADNLAVKGIALGAPRGRHLVTTPLEHEAVLASAEYLRRVHGFTVDHLTPDSDGLVSPGELARLVRPDTTLVSVQYANNEIGTIQPIAELAAVAREHRVPFHTDAVQAAGWLPLDVEGLGVDALSLSGHKVGAPKGVGVLWARGRLALEPVVHGGGQERGRRSGTENVAGAVALATALTAAEAERPGVAERLAGLRDRFIERVTAAVPSARVTGHRRRRLPGTASFVFAGTHGEAVLLELERRGVVCSSGSACAAGSDEPSHVLTALGLPAGLARTAVRFTFGPGSTEEEAELAAAAVRDAVEAVRGLRAAG